jgi:hypothetical protein
MQFSMHRPVWQTWIASFLLLWTLADLSVPGLCQSDDDGSQMLPVASQFENTSQVGQAVPSEVHFRMASNAGHPTAPSSQEDCFCCCAHIVPSPHFHFAVFQRAEQALTFYHFNQVTAAAPPLYHPPRS